MIPRDLVATAGDIRTLFTVGAIASLTDRELLELFVDGSEAAAEVAFESLVERHGPLVLRVCSAILVDSNAAQDAYQATFIVLARRAAKLSCPDRVAAWLHGVALRTARQTKHRDRIRMRHEIRAGTVAANHPVDDRPDSRLIASELAWAVHDEIDRLPEKLREPIILCHFQGLTHDEAARRLRVPSGTLSARVLKARQVLRARLRRQGVIPSIGLAAWGLGDEAVSISAIGASVPFLAGSMVRVCREGPLTSMGSIAVMELSRSVLRAMFMKKIKVVAATFTLAVVFISAALAFGHFRPQQPDGRRTLEEQAGLAGHTASQAEKLPEGATVRVGSGHLRHSGNVVGASFSPDGRGLASIGWDGAVRFWNPKTGLPAEKLHKLADAGSPMSVAYSADGTKMAIGRENGVLQLWDLTAGREIARSKLHHGRVGGVAFSPDSQTLGSASDEETCVRIWDAVTGEERLTLNFDEKGVAPGPLAFSPGGDLVALGASSRSGRGETIRIWDLGGQRQPIVIQKAHKYDIRNLAFSGIGRTLISGGSHDRPVRDESGKVMHLAMEPEFRIWDVTDGHQIAELTMPDVGSGGSFALTRDGQSLVSAHSDRLLVWNLESGEVKKTIALDAADYGTQAGAISLSPDGRIAAISRNTHTLFLVDLGNGLPPFLRTGGHIGAVLASAFTPDGHTLATAGDDGTIRLWDTANGSHRKKLELGVRGWSRGITVSSDGKLLVAVGESPEHGAPDFGGRARVWSLSDGRVLQEWRFEQRATIAALSPQGQYLAVATWRPQGGADKVHLFDVRTGRRIAELHGHKGRIHAVRFAPDGLTLATVCEDNTIRLWNASKGELLKSIAIAGHAHTKSGKRFRLNEAAFSPDLGIVVTSAFGDDQLIVWDLPSGNPTRTIRIEGSIGSHISISADGRMLASASATHGNPAGDDDAIRVWQLPAGNEVVIGRTSGVTQAVSFSADGKTLATCMGDSTVLLWELVGKVSKITP